MEATVTQTPVTTLLASVERCSQPETHPPTARFATTVLATVERCSHYMAFVVYSPTVPTKPPYW
jgi:hypothetical protein